MSQLLQTLLSDRPRSSLPLPSQSFSSPSTPGNWPGSLAQPCEEQAWSPHPIPRFPLQAAASAWGRAWPGRSCSCSLPASSTDTACCPRLASAPLPWTPRLPRPSPCGRQPRPSVWCPGPGALTQETSSDPGPSLGCSVEDGYRTNKGMHRQKAPPGLILFFRGLSPLLAPLAQRHL